MNFLNLIAAGAALSAAAAMLWVQPAEARLAPALREDLLATQFPGEDILAQASAAFASCNWTCTVVIPPSAGGREYLASSTLRIPLRNLSGPTLKMEGACIHYTGQGYAVDTYEVQPNPAAVRLRLLGGCLTGTARALGAIRLLPTSDVTISGTRIADFTQGDAVAVYGAEDVSILGNYSFTHNRYGVRLQGTFCRQGLPEKAGSPDYTCMDRFDTGGCDPATFAAHEGVCGYAGNMLHVQDGALSNLVWDIYEQGAPGLEHLSNSYTNNELNGGGGGIFLEMSRADSIGSNYFEGKTGRFLVLGNADIQPHFYLATAIAIESNYFTTNGQPAIAIENGEQVSVANNAELPGTPTSCFVDSALVGWTFYTNNKVASKNTLCRRGEANAGAAEAVMAHFRGDPNDPHRLEFAVREEQGGSVFLGGPALAPHGRCTATGQWVHSRDGHLSVCLDGQWVHKL